MKKVTLIDVALLAGILLVLTVCAFLVKPWVSADAIALIKPAVGGGTASNQSPHGCSGCSGSVMSRLSLQPGIAWVKKDYRNGGLLVAYDSRTVQPDAIAGCLTRYGYTCSVAGTMAVQQYCRRDSANLGSSILGKNSCGGYCRNITKKGEME